MPAPEATDLSRRLFLPAIGAMDSGYAPNHQHFGLEDHDVHKEADPAAGQSRDPAQADGEHASCPDRSRRDGTGEKAAHVASGEIAGRKSPFRPSTLDSARQPMISRTAPTLEARIHWTRQRRVAAAIATERPVITPAETI